MGKLRIEGFQSLTDVELEISGFTVITGRSNLGKTAVIRAMVGARFGLPGDHYIQQGRNACRVSITEDDGSTLVWQKVRKKKLDEEAFLDVSLPGEHPNRFTRFGGNNLEHTGALGFADIKGLRPQVAMQHDPIFLLTETPGTVAEIFKLLGRVDTVTTAQANAKRDQRKAKAELDIRTEDHREAEGVLADLDWVPDLLEQFGALSERWEKELVPAHMERTAAHEGLGHLQTLAPIEVPDSPTLDLQDTLAERALVEQLLELAPVEVPAAAREECGLEEIYWDMHTQHLLEQLLGTAALEVPESPADIAEPDTETLGMVWEFLRLDRALLSPDERLRVEHEIGTAENRIKQLKIGGLACPTCGKPL